MTRISPNNLPVVPDVEIDIFALFKLLWHGNLFVVTPTVVLGLLAAIYVYSITPEYEVNNFTPAVLKDLDELNRSNTYSLPPEQVLTHVGAGLDSYELRFGVFWIEQAVASSI